MDYLSKKKQIGQYTIYHTLGSGGTCKVKLGQCESHGKVAIKILKESLNEVTRKTVEQEVSIMQKLRHQNVLEQIECAHGVYQKTQNNQLVSKKDVVYVVMHLADRGCLYNYIADSGAFTEPQARYYIKQLLEGLDYCHFEGITHRDLKTENLLLDKNFNLKIADFGFAGPISGQNGNGLQKGIVGTERYMAPEIVQSNDGYRGPPADLFAVGVLLFSMVAWQFPFRQARADSDTLFKLIKQGERKQFWEYHDKYGTEKLSDTLKDLITALLQANPMHRPSICEVFAHKWFSGETATHEQIIEEFQKREVKVQEKLLEERKKKQELRDQILQQFQNNAVRASRAPQKPLQLYIETGNAKTRFFTTVAPDIVEEKFIEFLSTNQIDNSIKDDKYQIDFKYIVHGLELCGNFYKPENLLPVKKHNNTGKELMQPESIKMRMKISIIPEELCASLFDSSDQAYCVEFSRKEGDQIYFATAYRVLTQTILSFAIEAV